MHGILKLSLTLALAVLPFAPPILADYDKNPGPFYIVGGGAVGSYIYAGINDLKPTIITRSRGKEQASFVLSGDTGGLPWPKSGPMNQSTTWGDISKFPDRAVIIISAKLPDLKAIEAELQPRLNGTQTLVFIQNGVDIFSNMEFFKTYPKIVRTLVRSGIDVFESGNGVKEIRVEGKPMIDIAGTNVLNEALDYWVDVLMNHGFMVERRKDMKTAEWLKALVNLYMNGPTAAFDLTQRQITLQTEKLALAEGILMEAIAVARAEGVEISEEYLATVRARPRRTDRFTSMHTDVVKGKTTENEWLYGAVLRLAQKHGIATPHNREMYERLNAISSQAPGACREARGQAAAAVPQPAM